MLVTLQLPVRTHDGKIWLFVRTKTELPMIPYSGLGLHGWGLPHVLQPGHSAATVIREVIVDGKQVNPGSTGVFVSVQGLTEGTYNEQEVLQRLREDDTEVLTDGSPGWVLVPKPYHVPEPKQRDEDAQ